MKKTIVTYVMKWFSKWRKRPAALIQAEIFNSFSVHNQDAIRDFIANIENQCKQSTDKHVIEIPINHYFSKDVYAREMVMPKGALVVGKIHKHKTLSILSKGEVSILSIDGPMRIKAPYTFTSSPGVKRLIYAHEDTVWTLMHGTSETDLVKIEDQFIAKNYEELEHNNVLDFKQAKKLGAKK